MDIIECLENLSALRTIINRYKKEAENLEKYIVKLVNHHHEGQKTYKIDDIALTIKTGFNYLLNKEHYIQMKNDENPFLSNANPFNPVIEEVTPKLRTKVIKDAETYGTNEIIGNLHYLIKKKEMNPMITFKYS